MDKNDLMNQLNTILTQAAASGINLLDAENPEYRITQFYLDEDDEIYFECEECK